MWLVRCGGLLGLIGMLALADLWRHEVDQRIEAEHAHRVCRDMLGAVRQLNHMVTKRMRVPRHRGDETEDVRALRSRARYPNHLGAAMTERDGLLDAAAAHNCRVAKCYGGCIHERARLVQADLCRREHGSQCRCARILRR